MLVSGIKHEIIAETRKYQIEIDLLSRSRNGPIESSLSRTHFLSSEVYWFSPISSLLNAEDDILTTLVVFAD